MASLRDVQNQIVGVKKTKQITKAMNMVASAKLRNAQNRIERFRPYADKFYEMLGDLAAGADESVHPLLEVRDEVKTVGIMVTTSDRGLCGAFNVNIITKAMKLAQAKAKEGKAVKMYCIGKKARDAFKKTDFEIVRAQADAMGSFDFTLAASVGNELIAGYIAGELDEVHVVFGEFVSIAKQIPVDLTILPMAATEPGEAASGGSGDYLYEPSVEGLLAELLPRFIKVQVYRGLLDTSASEHAARMAAMDNATRACDDMTKSLTLLYNKTRQAAITADLMDIVGGAEALKG
ncbi:MAG: F0F1 ATP synthase subunit gamma [Pseudomonadota bacterium]